MASGEDKKNFGMDVTTWCRGRSTSRTAFGRILHTISAAPDSRPHRIRNEELGGEILVARNAEKEREKRRGLLDIDLNVPPPDEGGSDSPAAAEKKSSSGVEREMDFVVKAVNEGCVGNTESRNRIQAHCSKGGKNEINCFGEESKEIENTTIVTVSEEKLDQKMRKRRWNALLEVADNALREYEEEHGNKEEFNFRNRKRGTSRGLELGDGELLHKSAAADRKKINTGQRRRSLTEWNDYGEVAAAAAPPPPVVRSARGRALAMPNKYRDTVLDAAAVAVAEAEFRRHNKSGKSATVAPTKRKSR